MDSGCLLFFLLILNDLKPISVLFIRKRQKDNNYGNER